MKEIDSIIKSMIALCINSFSKSQSKILCGDLLIINGVIDLELI